MNTHLIEYARKRLKDNYDRMIVFDGTNWLAIHKTDETLAFDGFKDAIDWCEDNNQKCDALVENGYE